MAQNNQGWRESRRYQNGQNANDQWRDQEHREQDDWQQRHYRGQQNQYGQESLFHEENYPESQRYQSEWGSRNRDNDRQEHNYSGHNREQRGYDYQDQNQMGQQRHWSDRNDQQRYADEQGYRNPAGGSAERYGSNSYDNNNRNESNWNRNDRQDQDHSHRNNSDWGYSNMGQNQGRYGSQQAYGNTGNRGNNDRPQGQYGNQGMHSGKGPKGYKRSDDRIREDINDRLTDNSELDASSIEVEVSQGEVTLSGTVDSRSNKRLAEDLAEAVSGVQNVENRIRVQQEQPGSGTNEHRDATNLKNKRMSTEGSLQDHADRKTTKTV